MISTVESYERAVNKPIQQESSLEALEKENAFLSTRIEQLQDQADYYRAKALRLEEMANRFEYQGDMSSAEIKWEESKEYAEMAKRIEIEIYKLTEEREEVLYQINEYND
jgi:septal ring factor EnvC (AmiA/AmiB activator)